MAHLFLEFLRSGALAGLTVGRTARVGPWQSERSTGYAPPLAGCWAAGRPRSPRALGRGAPATPSLRRWLAATGRRTGGYPGDFRGVPAIAYAPKPDGQPDPGEIVWTWVPFEEDHCRGQGPPGAARRQRRRLAARA